ncbi:SprT family protein [Alkalihalobacillus sp. LMS6]|uniref:SprT family protein n=1 Tax=Alkalihalobacillus sp. LMS6 TaxID=2924034 RepID=UPI0020CFF0E7|nr:SprT family protein [Alkalihalobacillus sp. LMS6]UTR05716.1 SprT family protein [Alkalihalobacillus sp. LMS6]
MTNEELQRLTEELSQSYFDLPFKHKAMFNGRLRTTGGRYLLSSHHIELNEKHYLKYGKEELIGIIKHELCHYHLHLLGKGYRHGDKDFKQLLKKVGAPRFCRSVKEEKAPFFLVYQCMSCTQKYYRKRKVNQSKYVCGVCKGKLEFLS